MKRWLFHLSVVFGCSLIAVQVALWLPLHFARTDTAAMDFAAYYRAVDHFLHFEPVYSADYLYPPPFVAVLAPLGALSAMGFQRVWYSLVLAGFWVYAWGLARLAFRRPGPEHVLGVAVVAFFTPGMWTTLGFGNADIFVWALVAWGIAEGTATPMLVATTAKVYPACATLLMAWRVRRLSELFVGVAWVFAFTVLAAGFDTIDEWLRHGAMPLTPLLFTRGNVSLSTAMLRLLSWYDPNAPAARFVLHTVSGGIITVAAWATFRWPWRLQTALLVVVGAWAAPICWWYRFPAVLLVVAALWRCRGLRRGA